MCRDPEEIYAEFHDDPGLRVAIFSCAGNQYFSADWELKVTVGSEALLAGAPLALAAIKEVAQKSENLTMDEFFEAMHSGSSPAYHKALKSEDAREGINAFAEKRKPTWKNS